MPVRRSDDNQYQLAASVSATAAAVTVKGGEYILYVDGTPAGATVTLQAQSPNGTWATVQVFNASPVSFTTLPGVQTSIDLPAGAVRLAISGGTPSGINAYLVGLG